MERQNATRPSSHALYAPRRTPYTARMIGHLEGVVTSVRMAAQTRPGFLIISVGGVGYKVYATRETIAELKRKERAALWTHLAVREDSLDLYGFLDEGTLDLFELL